MVWVHVHLDSMESNELETTGQTRPLIYNFIFVETFPVQVYPPFSPLFIFTLWTINTSCS